MKVARKKRTPACANLRKIGSMGDISGQILDSARICLKISSGGMREYVNCEGEHRIVLRCKMICDQLMILEQHLWRSLAGYCQEIAGSGALALPVNERLNYFFSEDAVAAYVREQVVKGWEECGIRSPEERAEVRFQRFSEDPVLGSYESGVVRADFGIQNKPQRQERNYVNNVKS